MHCRSFNVRLAQPAAAADTDALSAFLGAVSVSRIHSALVPAEQPFWSILVFYREQPAAPPSAQAAPEADGEPQPSPEPLTPQEQAILDQLKIWRRERAKREDVPVYVIAHNVTLEQLARKAENLQTLDDLLPIERLGPSKVGKYGPELLEVLRVAAEE